MMQKVRILQFITPAGFYGAERWVLALANNIDPETMLCDLAVSDEGPEQDLSVADYYPRSAGNVHRLKMNGRFDWKVVSRLEQVIRERSIDVIHTHGYKSDILGLIAARRTGIKCVSTPHGFSGNVGIKLATFIRIGTMMLRYFDAVAPLSEELMADMDRLKVPQKRLRFIRNGVDLKEIDATPRDEVANSVDPDAEKTRDASHRTIGFIGQLIPRKGIPDLLNAFDSLYESDPAIKLTLVGDGAQRAELESFASGRSSGQAVEFLGFRSDRLALLSTFDLFVMTSSLEGIPRCMMEAMAMGIPCVAYDIPGVDQLIEHRKTGLLVPLGDTQALKAACAEVLNNAKLAATLKTAARNKVKQQYSAERMANEYLQLFRDLIGEQGKESGEVRGIG
ncbi:glycosyltransferase [Marinobacter salinus]|uniref:Glycosyltransferase n=1 Tax=Marinobacter salinus TaxID=1874317 RepID=A0A1D9GIM6_9GAMM|nr:glycosyltransferase family 4 protein [Marinobacter salinus]AOY87506.1 glycosyltransferase [Marinobacter salinus]